MNESIADVKKKVESSAEMPEFLKCKSEDLVCLNFKVPMRFRRRFKIYAAKNNMTMTEVLVHVLNQCLDTDGS